MNKVYLKCSTDIGFTDKELYGTGIANSSSDKDKINISLSGDKLKITYPINNFTVLASYDKNTFIDDFLGTYQEKQKIKRNIVLFCTDQFELGLIQAKGYDNVQLLDLNDIIGNHINDGKYYIRCKYHKDMKFYKNKIFIFNNDNEHYIGYGERILYL